jgi:2,4-dienoyl-CoA reductase-like NADH-dependent reductase (Old Yellow Enzyme family)
MAAAWVVPHPYACATLTIPQQTSDTINKYPVSSSDIQCPPLYGMSFGKPRPLSIAEIKDVVQRFAFAAKTLYDAGADGIQLHAAVSYHWLIPPCDSGC